MVRARLASGVAEEDRALAGVCERDADDCGDAMGFSVCHETVGGVYHAIPADDLPPGAGLEAAPAWPWMFNIDRVVDARPADRL